MKNLRSYSMAVEFYRLGTRLALPKHLRDQFERAASSIVLNLAEGNGRESAKDRKRFFRIAYSSCKECQAILDLTLSANDKLISSADSLAAHLYRLCQNTTGASG